MLVRPVSVVAAIAAILALQIFQIAVAQDAGAGLSSDDLRALQHLPSRGSTADEPPRPEVRTYQPVIPLQPSSPPSRLEELYSNRAGRPMVQFGYDFLGVPSQVSIAQTGAVSDDFVLGQGDRLEIALRGQENDNFKVYVDRDGRVLLPKLPPIMAAGRSFGDFRRDLKELVSRAYISTQVFVSLGELHQFSVVVTGDVRSPGPRIVNSLATPLDAILLSGGIAKTGSLRNVQLLRNGTRRIIDLYSIIAQGSAGGLGRLMDGDRIYVPPLGPTVGIAGYVRKPGIYELAGGAAGASAQALVRLAGGVEISGSFDLSKTSLDRDGSTTLIPVQQGSFVRSGEVLFVELGRNAGLGRVMLRGAVTLEQIRPISSARTVSDLVTSTNDLMANAYGPFAVIVRREPVTNATRLLPFSLIGAIARRDSIALQSSDMVYVFTNEDVRALAREATKNLNSGFDPFANLDNLPGRAPNAAGGRAVAPATPVTPLPPTTTGGPPSAARDSDRSLTLSPETAAIAQAADIQRKQGGIDTVTTEERSETPAQVALRLAKALGVTSAELVSLAGDNLVWVLDQVYAPGPYLAAKGTTLSDMIQNGGGVTQRADLSAVEVTSTEVDQLQGRTQTTRQLLAMNDVTFANTRVRPMDVIRLHPIFSDRDSGTVTVSGQVRFPGVFDITREERLSSLLQRAGGLTEVAYPYGAIFTRKQAAITERQGNDRAAREIESQLAILATSPRQQQQQDTSTDLNFLIELSDRLRNTPTLGRIVVTADPTVLAAKPELDVILQPGDALFLPKRPSSVTVSGEVLNSGSFQYQSGLTVDEYIRMAGGTTQSADAGSTFIVLPDGSATPRGDSWLSFGNGGRIPPGATIVVPRDLRPFDWTEVLKDITQITSQLAVTAASLSILGNNN